MYYLIWCHCFFVFFLESIQDCTLRVHLMSLFSLLFVLAGPYGIGAVCVPSCQHAHGLETCDQRAGNFNCAHLEGHQGCRCHGCNCLGNSMHPTHIPVETCRKFRSSSACQARRVACKWWKLGGMCIGNNEQPMMSCAPLKNQSKCLGPKIGMQMKAGGTAPSYPIVRSISLNLSLLFNTLAVCRRQRR